MYTPGEGFWEPTWRPPGVSTSYLVIGFKVEVVSGSPTHPSPYMESPQWEIKISNIPIEVTEPNQLFMDKSPFDGIIRLRVHIDGDLAFYVDDEGIHAEWGTQINVIRSIKVGLDGEKHLVNLTVDQWVQEPWPATWSRWIEIFDESKDVTFQ